MSELKDWRGTPITQGCHVVYPVRQSSSMWMNEAEVTDIITTTYYGKEKVYLRGKLVDSANSYTGNAGARQRKVVTISAIDRVTVV